MPYDTTIPGWMSIKELNAIERIATQFTPKNILEIGSLAGRSAVAWAKTLPESTVWVCDPLTAGRVRDFPGVLEPYLDAPFSVQELDKSLYGVFLKYTLPYSNIRHLRCYSSELPKLWCGPPFDLVFIDGDHTDEGVVMDLLVSKRVGKPGVVLCGHDFDHPYVPSVARQVRPWCEEQTYKLYKFPDTMIFLAHPHDGQEELSLVG